MADARAIPSSTELRHVSVLFCDLVGFTPLSESRDPAEVRELLSGYFDLARAIILRYGGVIEKFIGDAVMAVWGALAANEDDAERAVRAGLELTSAVSAYGADRSVDLAARVGIVTGEAATTETRDEGMVIGDRVNTAARIQSAAPPGTCYVDEVTRIASAAAIAYKDAGEHALKGKSEPLQLFEAIRVTAATAGSQRANLLEPPFTGRDHELRLLKELFHASADRHSARLLLVSGVAGIGKSRLAWEFFKYLDGLAGEVLWHSGRCLSYGDGVSYWALSEMVRARLQLSEEDPSHVVAERLGSGLERWISDPADREFIEPRLAQLLGLPTAETLGPEELFAGWRLFFERLAEHLPVVMVVEDLQWADAGLVAFLDHLLDWSADHAIFLLVLTRPEGADQPGLVLSRRNLTTLSLDRLSDELMDELLDGLVADLPAAARARIVERAEGVPLYAVETVRGLLDRDVLARDDDGVLHLVGELGSLETPPGLKALIAARLDALTAPERTVVKECAVLGDSFPRQAIEAVSDADAAVLGEILQALVRKEVLTVRADKLSPERGQYAFTQSLIRSIAYDTLTRAERKARHLRTAAHLQEAFPDGGAEVSEVVAAHLHDAWRAAGDAPDADEIRRQAKDTYVVAGDRAESVGAPAAAETAYLNAMGLSTDEAERTSLCERSGLMAMMLGAPERALTHFEATIAAHRAAGRTTESARVTIHLASSLLSLGRAEESLDALRAARASLDLATAPPSVVASLEERLGRNLDFTGRIAESNDQAERALALAQHHELPETYARALQVKAYWLLSVGRVDESIVYLQASLDAAQRHGLIQVESIARNLLADACMCHDRPGAEDHCRAGMTLARRMGARHYEGAVLSNLLYVLTLAGRFDEAYRLANEMLEVLETATGTTDPQTDPQIYFRLLQLDAIRGQVQSARAHLESSRVLNEGDDVQNHGTYSTGEAALALAEGDHRHALAAAERAIDLGGRMFLSHESVRASFPIGIDAALGLEDLDAAERLIAVFSELPPGAIPPFTRLQISRATALIASARGDIDGVEERLVAAEETCRELGYPYWRARLQLDLAGWLAKQGRMDEAATSAEAAAVTFAELGAEPALARASSLTGLGPSPPDSGAGLVQVDSAPRER